MTPAEPPKSELILPVQAYEQRVWWLVHGQDTEPIVVPVNHDFCLAESEKLDHHSDHHQWDAGWVLNHKVIVGPCYSPDQQVPDQLVCLDDQPCDRI